MEDKELWKPIEGYEGLYEVSNLGRIKALDRTHIQRGNRGCIYSHIYKGRIMKPICEKESGYRSISLYKNGKMTKYNIHRIVAKAFIPNPNNLPQINHKDENKTNNRADNLEWCSTLYNLTFGSRLSRIAEKRAKKVAMLNEDGKPVMVFSNISKIERDYGIHHSNIIAVCQGKRERAGGYKWAYLDDYNE